MHLPMQAILPNGSHVIVDAMTDSQISEMYRMIEEAQRLGEGFGVDEYPVEETFRHEVSSTGDIFVVCCKESGAMLGGFLLADTKFYRGTGIKVADPILIVKRSERGRGIGEFLFQQSVNFATRLSYTAIYTDTFCNNVAMMKIIERYPGFRKVGSLPLGGKMPDGTEVGTNIYYKNLRTETRNDST